MTAFDLHKIECARQDVNRAMSMLSLVIAGLRLEEDFQDQNVNRPSTVNTYIPSLGEMVDALLVCQAGLSRCWDDLGRKVEDL